jgi:hypothetical protein
MSTIDRRAGENQHAWPFMLPDGKHFLFQAFRSGSSRRSLIRMGTIGKLASVVVDSSESRAEFMAPDHLIYVKDGAVIARRFDLAKAKVVGNPVVIGENAGSSVNTEAFSASATGSVAFQSSNSGGGRSSSGVSIGPASCSGRSPRRATSSPSRSRPTASASHWQSARRAAARRTCGFAI